MPKTSKAVKFYTDYPVFRLLRRRIVFFHIAGFCGADVCGRVAAFENIQGRIKLPEIRKDVQRLHAPCKTLSAVAAGEYDNITYAYFPPLFVIQAKLYRLLAALYLFKRRFVQLHLYAAIRLHTRPR